MTKKILTTLLLTAITTLAAPKPNIVFILTDDQGWTDLSGFNKHSSTYYQTPALAKLASEGFTFNNAYSEPVCAPTRADLLTGLYPTRHHMYTVTNPKDGKKHQLGRRENQRHLDPKFPTISEILTKNGYQCAQIGKWHLGKANTETGPKARGFAYTRGGSSQGMPGGGKSTTTGPAGPKGGKYWAAEDGSFPFLANLPANGKSGQYLTDRLTEETITAIDALKSKPFFIYLPHYGVHAPVQAPQADIDLYKNQKPDPAHPGHKNKDYAAMVSSIDRSVDQILTHLKTTTDPRNPGQKLIANTLFIFMSDNGATKRTDNLPLRGYKASPYEGGVRVPLIILWKNQKGSTNTPVHAVDFFSTFAELCEIKNSPKTDGRSLLPLLENKPLPPRPIYRHQPVNVSTGPSSTITLGDYKLIYHYNTPNSKTYQGHGHYELFNIANPQDENKNLTEKLNLAAPNLTKQIPNKKHRQAFLELAKQLNTWLTESNAHLPYIKGTKTPVQLPKW